MASTFGRPPYDPSPAALLLGSLQGQAGVTNLVALPDASSDWYVYALGIGHVPALIITLGVVCAAISALNLCRPAPAPQTENSKPLVFASSVLLIIVWIAAFLSLRQGLEGYSVAASALSDGVRSAAHVQEDLVTMNTTAVELQTKLGGLLNSCHGLHELVLRSLGAEAVESAERLEAAAAGEILGYRSLVARLRPGVTVLSSLLHGAGGRTASWPGVLLYCFMSPVKLTAVSIIAFLAVSSARNLGGPVAEAVDTLGIGRLAATFVLAIIMSMTMSAGALLGLGSAAGAFCEAPDAAVLGLVGSSASEMGAQVLAQNVGRFYVLGEGQNPLLVNLMEARARADAVRGVLSKNAKLLQSMGLFCPSISLQGLNTTATVLQTTAERDIALLGEAAMYGHYEQAVRRGFCGEPLEAVGWLTLFQLALGLFCIPLAAALSRPFVGQGAGREAPQQHFPLADNFSRVGLLESGMAGRNGHHIASRDESRGAEQARLLGAEGAIAPPSSGHRPGSPLSMKSGSGRTPRGTQNGWASRLEEQRNGDVMNSLMESRADLGTMQIGGKSVLDTACSSGDVDFLREASRQGANVSMLDFARAYGNSFYSGIAGGSEALGRGSSSEMPLALRSAPALGVGGSPEARQTSIYSASNPATPAFASFGGAAAGAGGPLASSPSSVGTSGFAGAAASDAGLAQFVPKRKEETGISPDRRAKFEDLAGRPHSMH
mmetsp:Transcript_113718/g.294493  ORF Transcript_113718/g.294493 Transcript_113718/m.294493 type:complete len:719 (+) Transcript_113718:88-2244(+)